MNAWTSFVVRSHSQKHAQGPFKVSAYVDANLFAKKAVRTAIKARVPPKHFDRRESKQAKPPPPRATNKWCLDMQNSPRTVTCLYDRLGGFSGIQKHVALILDEAKSEPVLGGDRRCMDVLKSEQVIRYLCYVLGSKLLADEHCAQALVLELKEAQIADPDAPWDERAEALYRCMQKTLERCNASRDMIVEMEFLGECLKKKFLHPAGPQKRKLESKLLVRSSKTLIVPANVLDVTAAILHEAAEKLEHPLRKCFVNATINVTDVAQFNETSCIIYFSVIPQFFEYMEILKQHDVRSVPAFADVVRSRIETTYSEMVEKYEAELRLKRRAQHEKAEEKEVAQEVALEVALEVETEVKADDHKNDEAEAPGYQLYVPNPGSAPSTVRLESARNPEHTHHEVDHHVDHDADHGLDRTGYKLYVEDPDNPLSVLDLDEHKLELEELIVTSAQTDSKLSEAETFHVSLVKLCERHGVDVRAVDNGIFLSGQQAHFLYDD